ncbi:hypothetical protein EDC96DRAFT_522906 [Choanephora cucurbitarum]|nr:hypothetical protein EDC96DRAFT_522906 [Choanephora cucurbitarum]
MLTVISLTSIVLGILWSILVFVSLITGLVILIPVLLVSCLSAIIIVASYALYCHLFEKKM